jgi:hypothetical protein
MSRFPDAFRPPAFASWPSCSRRGFGLPHSRPTGQQRCRISTGFPRSTRVRNDRGGRPLYPGDGGVLPVEGSLFNRHLPLPSGQSLHPAGTSHRRDPNVTRHRRGFTHVHPPGLPLACDPRMGRGSLGFFPELRTPPLPATHVRAGTGHRHWPGTTPSTSIEPPIGVFTHLVRPRVAPSLRSRSARSLGGIVWASNGRRLPHRLLTPSHLRFRYWPFSRP